MQPCYSQCQNKHVCKDVRKQYRQDRKHLKVALILMNAVVDVATHPREESDAQVFSFLSNDLDYIQKGELYDL